MVSMTANILHPNTTVAQKYNIKIERDPNRRIQHHGSMKFIGIR